MRRGSPLAASPCEGASSSPMTGSSPTSSMPRTSMTASAAAPARQRRQHRRSERSFGGAMRLTPRLSTSQRQGSGSTFPQHSPPERGACGAKERLLKRRRGCTSTLVDAAPESPALPSGLPDEQVQDVCGASPAVPIHTERLLVSSPPLQSSEEEEEDATALAACTARDWNARQFAVGGQRKAKRRVPQQQAKLRRSRQSRAAESVVAVKAVQGFAEEVVTWTSPELSDRANDAAPQADVSSPRVPVQQVSHSKGKRSSGAPRPFQPKWKPRGAGGHSSSLPVTAVVSGGARVTAALHPLEVGPSFVPRIAPVLKAAFLEDPCVLAAAPMLGREVTPAASPPSLFPARTVAVAAAARGGSVQAVGVLHQSGSPATTTVSVRAASTTLKAPASLSFTEEDKKLSRQGLRLGAAPFCPGSGTFAAAVWTLPHDSIRGGLSPDIPIIATSDARSPSPQTPTHAHSGVAVQQATMDHEAPPVKNTSTGSLSALSPSFPRPAERDSRLRGSDSASGVWSSPRGNIAEGQLGSSPGGDYVSGLSAFAGVPTRWDSMSWPLSVIPLSPPSLPSSPDPSGNVLEQGGWHAVTPAVPATASGTATNTAAAASRTIERTVTDAAMWRSALTVTNTATGARMSPSTQVSPSGSPSVPKGIHGEFLRGHNNGKAVGQGKGSTVRVQAIRETRHQADSDATSSSAFVVTSGSDAVMDPPMVTAAAPIAREFPQVPYGVAPRMAGSSNALDTPQLLTPYCRTVGGFPSTAVGLSGIVTVGTTQSESSDAGSPRPSTQGSTSFARTSQGQRGLISSIAFPSESDLDRVLHNRVTMSDTVAKNEDTLVTTLFADMNVIEDDESEVEIDETWYGHREWWATQQNPASVPTKDVAVSPSTLDYGPMPTHNRVADTGRQRSPSFSASAQGTGRDAGMPVYGGGYWQPTEWRASAADIGGAVSRGAAGSSYRGDGRTGGARPTQTPTSHRHRTFSTSGASVASTMSLIDPTQPYPGGAANGVVGATAEEEEEWEMNSSAYADSLDEAQIQWIEEQLKANENPAGFF